MCVCVCVYIYIIYYSVNDIASDTNKLPFICTLLIHYLVTVFIYVAADVLESVDFLGSDGGQVFLLLNSSLVCCLTLDQEFGCISLVCCYDLRLSLSLYQDDELPTVAGAIVSCAFINPLLFVVTANGIVCILNNCKS